MTRPIPFLTVVLAVCFTTACGPAAEERAETGHPEERAASGHADARTRIVVPTAAGEAVRTEMRQMLTALNGSLAALANGDLRAVAEAARGGGTAIAVDVDPALRDRLPEEFVRLGMRTHGGFDGVAEAAEAGLPADTMLARLARLTGNCVACHQTYRLMVGEGE